MFLSLRCLYLSLIAALICPASSAHGGFCDNSPAEYCIDFDSGTPLGTKVISAFGNTTEIRDSGGNPGGYASVNDAVNGQWGAIILPPQLSPSDRQLVFGGRTGGANSNHHIDNIQIQSSGTDFTLTADLRVGGGTERPGDGFSLSLVRPDDPILSSKNGEGFAVSPTCDCSLPEEGAQTGISIAFDEWSSGAWDIVGMSLILDGEMVAQIPAETLNGSPQDSTSLQTGSSPDDLAWAELAVEVSNASEDSYVGSTVWIQWKGDVLFHETISPAPRIQGDFNVDGFLNTADVDLLVAQISSRADLRRFNLDNLVAVDEKDLIVWIHNLKNTWIGDANFDGEFNSTDFVEVLQLGKFERDVDANWGEGDWTGDLRFDTADLVAAFKDGGYELGPRVARQVPEPTFIWIAPCTLLAIQFRLRKDVSRVA